MSKFKRTAVIMAGGSGERFWPLSRVKMPKQLLKLTSDNLSMLEESIDRIAPLIPIEDIFIITSNVLLEPIRRGIPDIPPENVIAEPFKRNTAPCLALAASFIIAKYSDEFQPNEISMSVLTADQSIAPKDGFIKTINATLNFIESEGGLCTVGIAPSRPETGYGYIEINNGFNKMSIEPEIKKVQRFCEKPDFETAQLFLESGNYVWNSGMFFWRIDEFLSSLNIALPEVADFIMPMAKKFVGKTHLALPEALQTISEIFENFPNISIDYGLMEKAEHVYVSKALFNWDDVGSWDALPRIRKHDDSGNVSSGNCTLIEVKDSIIINESGSQTMTAVLGMENIVVVTTKDSIMICPKDRVQEVKRFVEKMRLNNNEKWL